MLCDPSAMVLDVRLSRTVCHVYARASGFKCKLRRITNIRDYYYHFAENSLFILSCPIKTFILNLFVNVDLQKYSSKTIFTLSRCTASETFYNGETRFQFRNAGIVSHVRLPCMAGCVGQHPRHNPPG